MTITLILGSVTFSGLEVPESIGPLGGKQVLVGHDFRAASGRSSLSERLRKRSGGAAISPGPTRSRAPRSSIP
jgi:hypothetical protein